MSDCCWLNTVLLKGFVPRELMSLGAERSQSTAAQLKITGHHQQHLLTWIHFKDKQTMFTLFVDTGIFPVSFSTFPVDIIINFSKVLLLKETCSMFHRLKN